MRGRLFAFALSCLAGLAALLASTTANAWYFPEHVVLLGDGHNALAPELRAIIAEAVAAARREGLNLCERTDLSLDEVLKSTPLRTPMIRTPASVACVPYVALPGLAGDHASDVDELRTVLTGSKGVELVSTVAYEWRRFRESALRGQSSLDRMSFVHDLDVALYFIDSGYVTRARATRVHFRDVGRPFDDVLRDLASQGRIDDQLGRIVFHHMRSLILAANGKRVEALLEHAFAIHFLEDAFASGHLAMSDASWALGRDAVRLRHDAFNDFAGRPDLANKIDTLASPKHPGGKIGGIGIGIDLVLGLPDGVQLSLAAMPVCEESILDGTSGILLGPAGAPDDVKNPCLFRVVAGRGNGSLLQRRRPERLAGNGKAGPHKNPRRSKRQGSRQATPVGDAAGSDHRYRSGDVDQGGHEAHRSPCGAGMASSVATLRNEDIRAGGDGLPGALQRLHLAYQPAASTLDGGGKGGGIAERQHYHRRFGRQGHLQHLRLLRQSPGDETNSDCGVASSG